MDLAQEIIVAGEFIAAASGVSGGLWWVYNRCKLAGIRESQRQADQDERYEVDTKVKALESRITELQADSMRCVEGADGLHNR